MCCGGIPSTPPPPQQPVQYHPAGSGLTPPGWAMPPPLPLCHLLPPKKEKRLVPTLSCQVTLVASLPVALFIN